MGKLKREDHERLKVLTYKFKPKSGFIRIVPISCIHLGHKNYNEKKAKGYLKYILETTDTYTIILGDTIENVLLSTGNKHPGSLHEQVMSVEEQRYAAVKLLKPLAEKKKILGWTESNHSIRSWHAAGFSVEQWIADMLGVPFAGTDLLMEITVGKQVYNVHATHGVGSSTTLPSVFGKLLAQSSRVAGADLYIRGHHHKKALADNVKIDASTGELRKNVIAATGCFMDYIDGYGHRKEYPPVVPGCVKLKLYSKEWDIHGTL